MTIAKTKEWFELAVSLPTQKGFNVQLGCHLEEVVEMLENLEFSDASAVVARQTVKALADRLKAGHCTARIIDPVEHLDALADQIVTAVGCAHMARMDIIGALDEVNRSNFSKFEDGKPVFNDQGKIKKGRDYSEPELARFVLKERNK